MGSDQGFDGHLTCHSECAGQGIRRDRGRPSVYFVGRDAFAGNGHYPNFYCRLLSSILLQYHEITRVL